MIPTWKALPLWAKIVVTPMIVGTIIGTIAIVLNLAIVAVSFVHDSLPTKRTA
jgi:ABC-type methionine transport system permease subunit